MRVVLPEPSSPASDARKKTKCTVYSRQGWGVCSHTRNFHTELATEVSSAFINKAGPAARVVRVGRGEKGGNFQDLKRQSTAAILTSQGKEEGRSTDPIYNL